MWRLGCGNFYVLGAYGMSSALPLWKFAAWLGYLMSNGADGVLAMAGTHDLAEQHTWWKAGSWCSVP
jgi:hypothetical protein